MLLKEARKNSSNVAAFSNMAQLGSLCGSLLFSLLFLSVSTQKKRRATFYKKQKDFKAKRAFAQMLRRQILSLIEIGKIEKEKLSAHCWLLAC